MRNVVRMDGKERAETFRTYCAAGLDLAKALGILVPLGLLVWCAAHPSSATLIAKLVPLH